MRLTTAPIPIVLEREQRYIVYCDASNDGLGCVLMQSSSSLWFSEVKES